MKLLERIFNYWTFVFTGREVYEIGLKEAAAQISRLPQATLEGLIESHTPDGSSEKLVKVSRIGTGPEISGLLSEQPVPAAITGVQYRRVDQLIDAVVRQVKETSGRVSYVLEGTVAGREGLNAFYRYIVSGSQPPLGAVA